MKRKLESLIREKEIQMAKLQEHAEKSDICSDLYDKILLEKAILKKQLQDMQHNNIVNRIKGILPHKQKLICDYFRK